VVSEDETEPDAQGKTIQQEKTKYFLTLDVSGTVVRDVRMQRSGEGTIKLNDKRQADAIHHQNILIAAWHLGYKANKTWAEQQCIALAACTVVSYDSGFKKVLGKTQVHIWLKDIKERIHTAGIIDDMINIKHKGSKSYTDQIEQYFPTYLYELYHYSTNIFGDSAMFDEIAPAMSEKSTAEEGWEVLDLKWYHMKRWFNEKGGKEKYIIKKSCLSDEQKQV